MVVLEYSILRLHVFMFNDATYIQLYYSSRSMETVWDLEVNKNWII